MAANESFESEEIETNRENTDDLLAVQLAQTPDNEDTFRPLLADAQKIGFFSLDRATQTNTTEIIEIKELTQTIEQLLEDSAGMRRDINFARSVMQAEFDAKLQSKAIELYHRVNEKIGDIEKMHEERVGTVRRAFRQQLADALVRVQSLYNQNMDDKIQKERKKKDREAGKWEAKFKEMQQTIQRNESIIQVLKMQLSQYQEKEEELMSFRSKSTKTPSINPAAEEEIDDLKNELQKLERQIDRLQEALDIKEKDTDDLAQEIDSLNQQLEKERILTEQRGAEMRYLRTENNKYVQAEKLLSLKNKVTVSHSAFQLHHERDELVNNVQAEAHNSKQQHEDQRSAWEQQLNDRVQKAREEALEEARREAAESNSSDREMIKRLMDEKRMAEQLLAKEKAKASEKTQEQMDLEKAKRNEQTLLSQISRLKKEIDRVHKTWEKKFAILQQSLHALKDESYLRQTMQKQATQLHQASISYAMDTPQGIMPKSHAVPPMSPKKPLPHIKNQKPPATPPDYISYTVSAPSGRATTLFSADGHVYPVRPPGEMTVHNNPSSSAFNDSGYTTYSPYSPANTAYGGGTVLPMVITMRSPPPPAPHPNTPYPRDHHNVSPVPPHEQQCCQNYNNSAYSEGFTYVEGTLASKHQQYLYETAMHLEEQENQVMSDDDEELPDEFMPLPGPPDRGVVDSRPSTNSQVIVVPNS